MKKLLFMALTIILFVIAFIVFRNNFLYPYDKETKDCVVANLQPITSFESGNLSFLKEAIGDSELVLLGEQNHGEGTIFEAKSQIVKYLHQNLGFEVIVFESDFYGINKFWDSAKSSDSVKVDIVSSNIYKIWTGCAETSNLFEYIAEKHNSENELIVSGNDPNHHSEYSLNNYLEDLSIFIEENNLLDDSLDDKRFFFEAVKIVLEQAYDSSFPVDEQIRFFEILEKLETQYKPVDDFWNQELENLGGYFKSALDTTNSNNIRDIQMAKNLLWLKDHKFKGKKIIFWGANYHIIKDFENLRKLKSNLGEPDTVVMGSYLNERIGGKLFSLGFTTHSGKAGRYKSDSYEIESPNRNFFESWIKNEGHQNAYIDFSSNCDPNKQFRMKSLMHQTYFLDWFKLYDGVIYLENSSPCTSI